jgi:hypothetical protein
LYLIIIKEKMMKKIILGLMVLASVSMAKMEDMPEVKPAPGLKEALVAPVVGALLFPGLIIGDAQWQYLTDRGNCDTRHFIVTLVPTPRNRDNFGLSVKVPCTAWFEKK